MYDICQGHDPEQQKF